MSASAKMRSGETISMPRVVFSSRHSWLGWGSEMRTWQPKPCMILAKQMPIFPAPKMPTVLW